MWYNKKVIYLFVIFSILAFLALFHFTVYQKIDNKSVGRDHLGRDHLGRIILKTKSDVTKKFVFFDLGANNGDSLYSVFGIKNNNYPKIMDISLISSVSWIVYAFEANPIFDKELAEVKKKLNDQGHTIFLFNRTAAWTYE